MSEVKLPEQIIELFDEDGTELGVQVFVKPEESCIIFAGDGLNMILPKAEVDGENSRTNAFIAAAIAYRINDGVWLEELVSSFAATLIAQDPTKKDAEPKQE